MPAKFQPLPDDEPQIELPQFLKRLKTEPAFAAKMRAHYDAMLAIPHSPETADMREKAAAALATLKHHQGILHATHRLEESLQFINSGDLTRARAIIDEAVDHLLDVCEPERTKFMKSATEIREMLDAL